MSANILDQLNEVDLSKVETSFPNLATGIAAFTVGKCEFVSEPSKKKPGEQTVYCLLELSLAQPWSTAAHEGVASRPINMGDRGSQLTERIYLGKYIDKAGEEKWYGLDTLTKLREAAFGKAAEGARFVPPEMIGQQVLVNLKFNPAPVNKDTKEVYAPRTEIVGYIKAKK